MQDCLKGCLAPSFYFKIMLFIASHECPERSRTLGKSHSLLRPTPSSRIERLNFGPTLRCATNKSQRSAFTSSFLVWNCHSHWTVTAGFQTGFEKSLVPSKYGKASRFLYIGTLAFAALRGSNNREGNYFQFPIQILRSSLSPWLCAVNSLLSLLHYSLQTLTRNETGN